MIKKKWLLISALGTMIEYYEYSVFAIFLPIITPLFFPSTSHYKSLVKAYYFFLFIAAARPLGAIFFGHIGDFFGRRRALLTSMSGISIATLLIGILPSHATIGVSATIVVVAAKFIQVFCFGGEYNGAGTYVVEHAEPTKEATKGSLLSAMTLFGSLIAAAIGIILTLPFMPEWSWRIAFILGGSVGIIGIFFRKDLEESPDFFPTNPKQYTFLNILTQHPKALASGIVVGGMATLPFTTVLVFINPVLVTQGILTTNELMLIQTLLILAAIPVILLSAHLADTYFSPRRVMQFSTLQAQ